MVLTAKLDSYIEQPNNSQRPGLDKVKSSKIPSWERAGEKRKEAGG